MIRLPGSIAQATAAMEDSHQKRERSASVVSLVVDDTEMEILNEYANLPRLSAVHKNSIAEKARMHNSYKKMLYFPEWYEYPWTYSDMSDYIPPYADYVHKRSIPELIHVLLSEPSSSICSILISSAIILLTILSVIFLVTESMPSQREYSTECIALGCEPVPRPFNDRAALPPFMSDIESRISREAQCRGCEPRPVAWYATMEIISTVAFSTEYLLRLFTAFSWRSHAERIRSTESEIYQYPYGSRASLRTLNFFLNPMNMIDLVSILPSFLESTGFPNTMFLRILRLFRIMKVAKTLFKDKRFRIFQEGVMMVLETIKIGLFSFIIFFLYAGVFTIIMGCIIFLFESGTWDPASGLYLVDSALEAQGNAVSKFQSVLDAMWYVVATTTTVGYGDIYPVTNAGRIAGVITIYGGIILLALPLSIIGGTFNDIYYRRKKKSDDEKEKMHQNALMVLTVMTSESSLALDAAFRRWMAFSKEKGAPEEQMKEMERRLAAQVKDLNVKIDEINRDLNSKLDEIRNMLITSNS